MARRWAGHGFGERWRAVLVGEKMCEESASEVGGWIWSGEVRKRWELGAEVAGWAEVQVGQGPQGVGTRLDVGWARSEELESKRVMVDDI